MQVQRTSPATKTSGAAALQRGVEAALEDIRKIQGRMTEELRVEDAIRGLSVQGGTVVADVDGRYEYKADGLKQTIAEHLAKHGIRNVAVTLRTLTDPQKAVDAANADITKIQARLTKDLRAEDGIVNLSFEGGTKVAVVLKSRQYFAESEVEGAVKALLKKHGLENAQLVMVRPAINIRPLEPTPLPPSVGAAAQPNKMKAKVDVFAADIRTVQSRMTEELRIEDAVKTIKVVGAKVVLTLHAQGPFERDGVTAWAKEELTKRGVTLPLVVKS